MAEAFGIVEAGPRDAPPVLLIHGLGLNAGMWRWLTPALAERHRVIAYDLWGHGESPPPPGAPDLALFAEQAAAVMDRARIPRAAVVGFSLGGMIARKLAQDGPGRVAALAILHSPHRRAPEAQAAVEARVALAASEGPSATVDAALERWFTAAFRAARPDVIETVRRWVLANDPALYPASYAVLAHGVEEVVAPDPPIRVPALVMTAREDHGNGPEMTRAIAAEIEGAEVVILEGLRHMAPAEAPERVAAPLLAFLDRALAGVRHG